MAEASTVHFTPADYQFLETLFDPLTDAVVSINPESERIIHWNKAAAVLLGHPATEAADKTIDFLGPGTELSESISNLLAAIRKRGTAKTKWQLRVADGSMLSVHVTATLVRGESHGEFLMVILRQPGKTHEARAPLDVETREEELQSLNARLLEMVQDRTRLIQLQREVWILANQASNIDQALEGTMDKICKKTAFPCPETALLIGHIYRPPGPDGMQRTDYWCLSDSEKLANFRAATEKIRFEADRGLVGRVMASRKLQWVIDFASDQNDLRAEAAKNAGLQTAVAFPILASDYVIAVMEIFTSERVLPQGPLADALSQIGVELGGIAERKRTEEKLRQNELLATIGLTAAKLAHEISNPLNGMYTAIQLLEQTLHGQKLPPDDVIPATVKDLKKELDRLRLLLHEFRTLSRPMKFEFESLNVADIARDVVNLEAARYGRQGITVEVDFPSDLPKAKLDGEKIRQALLNLCQNAADAMPRGGTLTLRGYKLWEAICLEVQDTGAGLPEGINIFDVFTTTKRGGTGLGLPIVQQIVSGHGGGISFTSEREKGTMFRLTLPLNPTRESRSTNAEPGRGLL